MEQELAIVGGSCDQHRGGARGHARHGGSWQSVRGRDDCGVSMGGVVVVMVVAAVVVAGSVVATGDGRGSVAVKLWCTGMVDDMVWALLSVCRWKRVAVLGVLPHPPSPFYYYAIDRTSRRCQDFGRRKQMHGDPYRGH